jgi:glucose/arabinose dehydrogenase
MPHWEELMMSKSTGIRFIASIGVAWGLLQGVPAARATSTVVMSGLDSPRGLAIGPEGGLYVVEAGHGGAGPCSQLRGITFCIGPSGALTRLFHGTQERVLTGLPSLISAAGEVTGAHDVSFQGRGGAYITTGLGGNPALRGNFGPAADLLGMLLHVTPGGRVLPVADLAAFEGQNNPDGGIFESNPFGVLARPGGWLATDAGGNSLLHVEANGDVSTVAVFPSRVNGRPTDAVPTSVVVGPDGAYYVSELSGVPFATGAARIYRVVPGQAPTVYLTGFTTVIDLAFGPDDSLYVLEHSSGPVFFGGPGKITRITPSGTRTVVVTSLDRPTSLVVDSDGTIYVTNHGISMGSGEVIKIEF